MGNKIDLRDQGAIFSSCRTWRYTLWRTWDFSKWSIAFLGLNPSTATETVNDPTVRRCIGYAYDWGFGGLIMLNIFALRSTDPKALYKADDPIGPENDEWIKKVVSPYLPKAICAWGNHGAYLDRGIEVIKMLTGRELHHLGKTKTGHPKHPLYLPKTLKPIPMEEIHDLHGDHEDISRQDRGRDQLYARPVRRKTHRD